MSLSKLARCARRRLKLILAAVKHCFSMFEKKFNKTIILKLLYCSYGRALISLGDYSEGEKRLLLARNRCPKEEYETINSELLKVQINHYQEQKLYKISKANPFQ
jgi:hypothetical protein